MIPVVVWQSADADIEIATALRGGSMNLTFAATNLRCLLDCSRGKKTLKGGRLGWYHAAEISWRYSWKLRAQVSVTEIDEDYAYPTTAGTPMEGSLTARGFSSSDESVHLIVDRHSVDIEFDIPDCIGQFRKSGAFGCAAGGPIRLPSGNHHLQALLVSKSANSSAFIKREGLLLEFCVQHPGRVVVLGTAANRVSRYHDAVESLD
jgi:hypothetical protein